MFIDLTKLSATQVYHTMIQTILPRPVAWILSENPDASFNLAPFSYFSAVSSEPPLVSISIGSREGMPKDTRRNIMERKDFVIHIASAEHAEQVSASAAPLPYGESEIQALGLQTVAVAGQRLPRLALAKAALFCSLEQHLEFGEMGLIIARVHLIHVDDAVCSLDAKGRPRVQAAALDPLCRLGGTEYARLGQVFSIP